MRWVLFLFLERGLAGESSLGIGEARSRNSLVISQSRPSIDQDDDVKAALEKTEGDTCPRCSMKNLDVYYEEGSGLRLGARCSECGLKGFYVNGKLQMLAVA